MTFPGKSRLEIGIYSIIGYSEPATVSTVPVRRAGAGATARIADSSRAAFPRWAG